MPQLSRATTQNVRASMFLKNDLRQSARIERNLEKKSLRIKKKLVKDRDRTLRALLRSKKDKDRQGGASGLLGLLFGGGIGGALLRNRGKPGSGGGGGLFSRFRKPRVPNTPGELLRMQRGTGNVSRLSRFGRLRNLGRISKANVITNTLFAGFEFAGRKSEGQTNLQAGVGTAGSVTGGILGAAIGQTLIPIPVLGALIGGAVGSTIGGGIADFLTGANRRRKFEEQRVLVSAQKSLFSGALDDFERVLNKFELAAPFLSLKGDEDEFLADRNREIDPFGPKLPPIKPPTDTREIDKDKEKNNKREEQFDEENNKEEINTKEEVNIQRDKKGENFFTKPEFVIPVTAVITAAVMMLMAEPGDLLSFGALATRLGIKKSQLAKVKSTEALMRELQKKNFPGLSKKGIRVRIENAIEKGNRKELERILKESLKRDKNILKRRKIDQDTARKIKELEGSKEFSNLVKEMKKRGLNIKDFLRKGKFLDEATDDLDVLERAIEAAIKSGVKPSEILKKGKVAYDTLLQNRLTRLRELEKIFDANRIQINADRVEDMRKAFEMIQRAKNDFIRLYQKISPTSSSNNLDPSSNNLAMNDSDTATNNFFMGGSNSKKGGLNIFTPNQEIVFGGSSVSPFNAMTKYAENMALLTT